MSSAGGRELTEVIQMYKLFARSMGHMLQAAARAALLTGTLAAAQTIPVSGPPAPAFAPLDQTATALMQKYSIPGMALGITKGGRLVFARGYGFADVDARTTVSPDSLFRLASVSKPLTATAADKLVELGLLRYDTNAFQVLAQLQPSSGAQDPRVQAITVLELMMHQSGWGDSAGYNRYADIQVAAQAANLPLPGTFEDLIQYELGRPLDYDPGTKTDYCNFCYGVLAEVVQSAAAVDYETYVRGVLANIGLAKTRIGRHLQADRFPGEVTYYVAPGTPLVPPIYAGLPPLVPIQYGGIAMDWGTGSAAGAWVSNPIELLRLVASVTLGQSPAMFKTPPRSGWAFSGLPIGRGWEWVHDGGIPGTSTRLHISDDTAWCILLNTDNNGGAFINDFDTVVKSFLQSVAWPDGDLFSNFLPNLGTQPIVTAVSSAFTNSPVIAPNTWVEIHGTNLAPPGDQRIWQSSDFTNGQLPTQLDGVSVTVNGHNAFVYYISPTQINILTPPNKISGPVQVQVTVGSVGSSLAVVKAQAQSPSLFDIVSSTGVAYVYARHVDGSLVGPASLVPGQSTPAAPGETIAIAANGFGPTDTPIAPGDPSQSGLLPQPWPLVTIGGLPARVSFAGLAGAGIYQLNITVPTTLGPGDYEIVVSYNGATTQPGVLISCAPGTH